MHDFILKFLPDVKSIFSSSVIKTSKSNAYVTRNNNRLKKAKFDCIHHTKITENHLNAYGLHINWSGTKVLAKNLISDVHVSDAKRIP